MDDPAAPWPPPVAVGRPDAGRGWAVPGSAEAQPPPPPGAAATPGGGAPADADRTGGEGGVPQVGLRPMTVADVLDGGFAVVKARPARILGITALFVVPTQLITAYLLRDISDSFWFVDVLSDDPTVLNEQATSSPGEQLVGTFLAIVIPALALVYVAGAIAHLVSQWLMGRDATAREMLGAVGRRSSALLGSFVIVKLAEVAGAFACYIGLLFVMPLFVAVAPAIGVERVGAGAAVSRSVRLIRPRYWRTMGIALLMGLVATLLGNALSALPQALSLWLDVDDWPLLALGGILAQIVVVPFVAAATVLLYFDLRVRTEGLDIEMTATDLFGRAA